MAILGGTPHEQTRNVNQRDSLCSCYVSQELWHRCGFCSAGLVGFLSLVVQRGSGWCYDRCHVLSGQGKYDINALESLKGRHHFRLLYWSFVAIRPGMNVV